MWALCRSEHGLSWEEFEALTLAQFEALEERRAIAIRHDRFNAALVASAVYNMHRSSESDPISPFDFLPGFETDAEEADKQKARKSLIHAVKVAVIEMRFSSQEAVQAEKARMLERMRNNGVEDPEDIMQEAFPD